MYNRSKTLITSKYVAFFRFCFITLHWNPLCTPLCSSFGLGQPFCSYLCCVYIKGQHWRSYFFLEYLKIFYNALSTVPTFVSNFIATLVLVCRYSPNMRLYVPSMRLCINIHHFLSHTFSNNVGIISGGTKFLHTCTFYLVKCSHQL